MLRRGGRAKRNNSAERTPDLADQALLPQIAVRQLEDSTIKRQ
jgi:hypothetical protein